MEKETLKIITKLLIVTLILLSIIRDCTEKSIYDLAQIKSEHFHLIVKKIDKDNNIRKRIFTGKTTLGRDTVILTSVFSSIDLKINDTIEKRKDELVYTIKNKNMLEKRTYFVNDYGECDIKIQTFYR